jgi:glycosyltransferase involved in cell wall biosynthesis
MVPGIERLALEYLPPDSGFPFPATGAKRLAELLGRGEIVHLHGVWEPILRAAAGIAYRAGLPYAVAPHGMLYPWSLNRKWLKKQMALVLGYRRMLNRAAFLHALNADEKEAIGLLGLRPRIEILPNGVFPDEIESLPPRGEFYAAHPELAGKPYILFLSRLHPGKGLHYLADALAILAKEGVDVRLVVAGPDFGAKEAFEQQVLRLGIADRVHVVGPIYGSAKTAALVDATCFCLPSEHETFSMAITEAMGCGLAVVISENCHFSEVAQVGAGRTVKLNAKELAEALRHVITNPAAREKMAAAGRALVEQRFTWPRIAEQAVKIYERVLGQPAIR